jgi:uncharacterized protein YegP (UPF0339 family)
MGPVIVTRRFAAGGYYFVLLSEEGDLIATSDVFEARADCYAFVEAVRRSLPELR